MEVHPRSITPMLTEAVAPARKTASNPRGHRGAIQTPVVTADFARALEESIEHAKRPWLVDGRCATRSCQLRQLSRKRAAAAEAAKVSHGDEGVPPDKSTSEKRRAAAEEKETQRIATQLAEFSREHAAVRNMGAALQSTDAKRRQRLRESLHREWVRDVFEPIQSQVNARVSHRAASTTHGSSSISGGDVSCRGGTVTQDSVLEAILEDSRPLPKKSITYTLPERESSKNWQSSHYFQVVYQRATTPTEWWKTHHDDAGRRLRELVQSPPMGWSPIGAATAPGTSVKPTVHQQRLGQQAGEAAAKYGSFYTQHLFTIQSLNQAVSQPACHTTIATVPAACTAKRRTGGSDNSAKTYALNETHFPLAATYLVDGAGGEAAPLPLTTEPSSLMLFAVPVRRDIREREESLLCDEYCQLARDYREIALSSASGAVLPTITQPARSNGACANESSVARSNAVALAPSMLPPHNDVHLRVLSNVVMPPLMPQQNCYFTCNHDAVHINAARAPFDASTKVTGLPPHRLGQRKGGSRRRSESGLPTEVRQDAEYTTQDQSEDAAGDVIGSYASCGDGRFLFGTHVALAPIRSRGWHLPVTRWNDLDATIYGHYTTPDGGAKPVAPTRRHQHVKLFDSHQAHAVLTIKSPHAAGTTSHDVAERQLHEMECWPAAHHYGKRADENLAGAESCGGMLH